MEEGGRGPLIAKPLIAEGAPIEKWEGGGIEQVVEGAIRVDGWRRSRTGTK